MRGGVYASSQIIGTSGATVSSYIATGEAAASTVTATATAASTASTAVNIGVGYYAVGAIFVASTIALIDGTSSGTPTGDDDDNQRRRFPTYFLNADGTPYYTATINNKFPEVVDHIRDAILDGHPDFLHLETIRRERIENYNESTAGYAGTRQFDRDEYPFKSVFEGGINPLTGRLADIRYVLPGENRRHGADLGVFYETLHNIDLSPFYVVILP